MIFISTDKEKVRTMLNSYLLYMSKVKNLELEIKEIELNYDLNALASGESSGHTNKISREVENRIVNKDESIEKLMKTKELYETKCNKMEQSLIVLKEFEKQVIEEKYMKTPVDWNTVARKLGFSISACKQAEDRAVNKMIGPLFKCI